MLHLLQLLRYIVNQGHDLSHFYNLFSDLTYEIDEMGYKGHESELIKEMVFNHYLIELEDDRQLAMISKCILDKVKFKASIETTRTFTL